MEGHGTQLRQLKAIEGLRKSLKCNRLALPMPEPSGIKSRSFSTVPDQALSRTKNH
jgi:hypothetical protein